jgi:hypothetical protein
MQRLHEWSAGRYGAIRGDLMLDILPHLIWAGVVVFLAKDLKAFAHEWKTMKALDPLAPVEVPEDLIALANQERETWAQEETLRAMRERYEALGDWTGVRAAFGIGRRHA